MTREQLAELLALLRAEPEVRRYLQGEVKRRQRARLEADAARERERVCAACGEPFTSASADAVYHSNACRQRAYRRRQRAGRLRAPEAIAA